MDVIAATTLPARADLTPDLFIKGICAWARQRPGSTLDRSPPPPDLPRWNIEAPSESLSMVRHQDSTTQRVALRHVRTDDDWVLVEEAVLTTASDVGRITFVATRIARNAAAAMRPPTVSAVMLPELLDRFAAESDGWLDILPFPHKLAHGYEEAAAGLLHGECRGMQPLLYLSAPGASGPRLDADVLAERLWGIAHVVVEPDTAFSDALAAVHVGEAPTRGEAVLVWGGRAGRLVVQPSRLGPGMTAIITADTIVRTLARAAPTADRFDAVESDLLRQLAHEAHEAANTAIELAGRTLADAEQAHEQTQQFTAAANAERDRLTERVADLERRLQRTEQELRDARAVERDVEDAQRAAARDRANAERASQLAATLQSRLDALGAKARDGAVCIPMGREHDLYPGEIRGVVREALAAGLAATRKGSRRQHILQSIIDAMPDDGELARRRDALKAAVRDYQGLGPRTRADLARLGIEVLDTAGPHHKLLAFGDARYAFALPRSPSDRRGGLNSAQELCALIY